MRPAGYMAKRISGVPDGFGVAGVVDIYSVSACLSRAFADYVEFFAHNAFGLFDTVEAIRRLVAERSIDLGGTRLFYYETHEDQFDENGHPSPIGYAPAGVAPPARRQLAGFDVVSFSMGHLPECSPLSCNGLAKAMPVNRHCLFDSVEDAIAHLRSGAFRNSEPGPYRVMAVYTIEGEL
jgi:hypothetical protein